MLVLLQAGLVNTCEYYGDPPLKLELEEKVSLRLLVSYNLHLARFSPFGASCLVNEKKKT